MECPISPLGDRVVILPNDEGEQMYGNIVVPDMGKEKPENPYGYSKYVMDQIAEKLRKQNPDFNIVGLRYFNVYGHNEFHKGKTASMVIQLGHQILSGNAPRLFENSNKIFRDFIHISDVIQANVKACGANGTYNIGTGIPRSFQDIADILQNQLGTDLGTEYFKNPYDGYQSNTNADITKSIKDFNFNPSLSLEEGILEYLPEIQRLHKISDHE